MNLTTPRSLWKPVLSDDSPDSRLSLRVIDCRSKRSGRHEVLVEIRRLVVRMVVENRTWDDTRVQGALNNVGYRVGSWGRTVGSAGTSSGRWSASSFRQRLAIDATVASRAT